MIKALKVVMIVWSVLLILYSLAFIFIPQQFADMPGWAETVWSPSCITRGPRGVACRLWDRDCGLCHHLGARPPEKHYMGESCHSAGCSLFCH